MTAVYVWSWLALPAYIALGVVILSVAGIVAAVVLSRAAARGDEVFERAGVEPDDDVDGFGWVGGFPEAPKLYDQESDAA